MEQIEKTEKYILVAVATGEEEAAWASLEELGELDVYKRQVRVRT